MSLEKMVSEVLNQAKLQENSIISEAKAEAEKISKQAEAEAERQSGNFFEKTNALAFELEKKELSSFKLKLNKEFFEAKKQALQEISSTAFQKIAALNGDSRSNVLKNLAAKAASELKDAEFFYCSEKDRVFFQKILPKLKFAGTVDIAGGIIVENFAKNIRVNCSFETLFDEIKGAFLNEVSSRVF